MVEHSLFLWLVDDVLAPLLERAWGAYRRVLNLPLLAAVVADGAVGVGVGATMRGSASPVTWLLGILLLASSGLFAAASVCTWIGKVREERDDEEYRLRRAGERSAIAGREAGGLDSPGEIPPQTTKGEPCSS